MKKSEWESTDFSLKLEWIEKMVREIEKYILTYKESLFPIQHKRTSTMIMTSGAIPPGGWVPIETYTLPPSPIEELDWFRRRIQIPYRGENERVILDLWFCDDDLETGQRESVEGLVYLDGKPYQGIDGRHKWVFLPIESESRENSLKRFNYAQRYHRPGGRREYTRPVRDFQENQSQKKEIELTLRVYFKPKHKNRRISHFRLAKIHYPSFALHQKLNTLRELLKLLEPSRMESLVVMKFMEETLQGIPWTQPGGREYYRSIEKTLENFELPQEIRKGIQPTVVCVGHSHIDCAWLWSVDETRRKVQQTFATAVKLMEEYPRYRFLQSQPLLYEFIERTEPETFHKIEKFQEKGQWIPDGAMWVEPDCNIPGGEALIRQIYYGKKYFKDKFLCDSLTAWLPDTFGFNGNLPQILKKSGVPYFVTSKMSWNQFTRFPHDLFLWKGIDGSEIIAHFLVTPSESPQGYTTCSAGLTPKEIQGTWENFSGKRVSDQVLLAYGYGDGGEGPTREMCERLPFLYRLPGLPHALPGSPLEFFRKIEDKKDKLPVHKGELYLEYHRGTLTSRGRIKSLNRKAESSLNALEKALVMAEMMAGISITEEHREFMEKLWKSLLLNHFHDIIAGSSIHEVNLTSEKELQTIIDSAKDMTRRLIASIGETKFNISAPTHAVFNPLAIKTLRLIEVAGDSVPSDAIRQDNDGWSLFPVIMEPLEICTLHSLRPLPDNGKNRLRVENWQVISDFYRLEVDERGRILSMVDTSLPFDREIIGRDNPGNDLVFYEDRPLRWDAWDIDEYYRDTPLEAPEMMTSQWIEMGPVRAILEVTQRFRHSVITQSICFYGHTPKIDFKTHIEWNDINVLLKTHFPLLLNADKARFEIPMGYIERPTHSNTLQDRAMFEVSAHRWGGIFEKGYGVALLNNGKYGYSVKENVLSMSLLKSSLYPDTDGEKGVHEFTYSLYPTAGEFPTASLIEEALVLNNPVIIAPLQGRIAREQEENSLEEEDPGGEADRKEEQIPETGREDEEKSREEDDNERPEMVIYSLFRVESHLGGVLLETIKPAEKTTPLPKKNQDPPEDDVEEEIPGEEEEEDTQESEDESLQQSRYYRGGYQYGGRSGWKNRYYRHDEQRNYPREEEQNPGVIQEDLPEEGQNIILRLYESLGSYDDVRILVPSCIDEIYEVNLMEQKNRDDLPIKIETDEEGNPFISLAFRPFEIRTLYLRAY